MDNLTRGCFGLVSFFLNNIVILYGFYLGYTATYYWVPIANIEFLTQEGCYIIAMMLICTGLVLTRIRELQEKLLRADK